MDERAQDTAGASATTDTAVDELPRHGAVGEGPEEVRESGEDERFWPEFRKRIISWRTMKPQQRLITGAAVAQVLAAGLIIALHGLPATTIYMGMPAGHGVQMAVPFFWTSLAFLMLSLSFLMTGALMLRWPIRLLALAALSALTLFSFAPVVYTVFRLGMVALVWLWAGFAAFAQLGGHDAEVAVPGKRLGAWRRLRSRFPWLDRFPVWRVTLVFLLAWQALLYLALLASTGWTLDPSDYLFQLTVATQLQSLVFVLIPFLFLAGSDFAELGELIAAAVAHATRAPKANLRIWFTLGLTFALAVVIAIISAPTRPKTGADLALAYLGELLVAAVIALILSGLLGWGRAITWVKPKAGPAMLLLVTLGYFAATWVGMLSVLLGANHPTPASFADYSVYTSPATAPTFSLIYPTAWTASLDQPTAKEIAVSFNGIGKMPAGAFFVDIRRQANANADTAQQDQSSFIAGYLSSGRALTVTATGTDGVWQVRRFTLTDPRGASSPLDGESWWRAEQGQDVTLVGLAVADDQPQVFPIFAQMTHSWRPDANAQAPDLSSGVTEADAVRIAAIFESLVPLVLGLVLGFWLVRRGKAHHRAWQVAGVFVATLGLLVGAPAIPTLLTLAGANGKAFWFLQFTQTSAQQAIALATVVLVVYVALRQCASALWLSLVRLTLALNVGLLFISLMYQLYDKAISVSQHSADSPLSWAAALIVVIALGWDLLMSGETFTNRDDHLPRSTRLLLYLGYITLTATLVMFFSSQTYTVASGSNTSAFESEPWPQLGLLVLGPAMVITAFALSAAEWVRHMRRRHQVSYDDASEAWDGAPPEALALTDQRER